MKASKSVKDTKSNKGQFGVRTKDTRTGSASVEETLRKAAEEEAERKRLAEEARLAALRDEELKLKHNANPKVDEKDKQMDLLNWVKSVPLSDPCITRVDRAFSDGSLLAEVIHHFCPDLCDKRGFFRWYSKSNKLSNWLALNYKVFPKLGFRLTEKQMNNLACPFQCGKFEKNCTRELFIFKLLNRVRKELAERNPKVLEYDKSKPVGSPCKKKVFKRKLMNFLENPAYSRVEMLLENGFYDKDKENGNEDDLPTNSSSCYSNSEPSFPTYLPCSVPATKCFTVVGNGANYNGIYIQPSLLSCNCAQPTPSYFQC